MPSAQYPSGSALASVAEGGTLSKCFGVTDVQCVTKPSSHGQDGIEVTFVILHPFGLSARRDPAAKLSSDAAAAVSCVATGWTAGLKLPRRSTFESCMIYSETPGIYLSLSACLSISICLFIHKNDLAL